MTSGEIGRVKADWLSSPSLRAVLSALDGKAYYVGGCVRNALLGAPVDDIDLATPLRPKSVMDRLTEAGLQAVPTGIEHGTVTAVSGGHGYEITTFRADVRTDGRRAVVRFTDDIAEDAGRRDFTMNALYADATGKLIDPLGGLPDLNQRRVRFVGDPERRIREDYLRVLRFFRFHAWYGRGALDPDGLAAVALLATGIRQLARERVGAEVRKLLNAPDPVGAVQAMGATGVLDLVLLGGCAAALPALLRLEAEAGAVPDWRRRLALLTKGGGSSVDDIGRHLRLSRADAKVLERLSTLAAGSEAPQLMAERDGVAVARSALLVRLAHAGQPLGQAVDAALAAGAAARFPLSAADLMREGWRPGPSLGAALDVARQRWRESDFSLDKAALLREAHELGHKD